MVKTALKARLPGPLLEASVQMAHHVRGLRPIRSWSQTGEDLLIASQLAGLDGGFYVDVGAFHPRLGSNTKLLYDRGWRGMNLDPRPGSMRPFAVWRRRDINLEVGAGEIDGTLEFFRFAESELSTFDAEVAQQRMRTHRLLAREERPVRRLAALLAEHSVPDDFDLLTIDCEGWEEAVLRGSDWARFRPQVVVIEAHGRNLGERLRSPAGRLLEQLGYDSVSATSLSTVYKRVALGTRGSSTGPLAEQLLP